MKKLLIIDANSLINRAFYGVRFLSASDGTPTNAVYGFLMTLLKLLEENKPDYVVAAFDLKAPTFRHKMYAEYKAQRKPMPEGLVVQMPIAKDILGKMGVAILEKEGYEADDIIGTVSAYCEQNGIECLIATGDKDDLQLASDKVKVLLTVTKMGRTDTTVYDAKAVFDKYGVTPAEFIDVKALMGDTSDNIPGVKGIGEKTALGLIAKAKSIENLYADLEGFGVKGAALTKLENGIEDAKMSKVLATIDRSVPIEIDLGGYEFKTDKQNPDLYNALKHLDLNKIIDRMGLEPVAESKSDILEGTRILDITSEAELDSFLQTADGEISIVLEFDGKNPVSAAAAIGKTAAYCTIGGRLTEGLKSVLANESIKKYMINAKDSFVNLDTPINNLAFDIAIAEYLINPARTNYTAEGLAYDYFGLVIKEQNQMSLFDSDSGADKAKEALIIKPIAELTAAKLEENGQTELYYNVELPLIEVLASMQKSGVLIDRPALKSFSEMLSLRINELTDSIYNLTGEEFNINSPKQLGEMLFEKMGLEGGKKTKNGYKTGAEVLEKIRFCHPVIDKILEYRKLTKLKSTYCDGLEAVINPETHRIHSVFNQTVTVTGRISSSEPNMQNIPTRTPLGSEMRKMFVAKDGCTLLDADYSQIELRVLAHMSGDREMSRAFLEGEDIHTVTASQVFGVAADEVTPEMRRSAKAVNFGIVYGIGEYSLSQDLGITVKQARTYINNYLSKYSGVRDFMENTKEFARTNGYVKTIMNRIRYIPEITMANYNMRAFGERAAMNAPIQGSAADIIKLAMVKIYCRLKNEGLKSKLILQVHDELIIETEESEKQKVSAILKEEMENAVKLSVPLTVDMSEGKSWYDAK